MRVRESILSPRYGHVEGQVGEVIEIEDDQIRVRFPNRDSWWSASELLPAAHEILSDNLQVGSKVRVCAQRPICGWGNAAPGEIGEVVQIQFLDVVMVRFPQEPKWQLGISCSHLLPEERRKKCCCFFFGDIVS